ncbi:MAG: phospholipase [Deltaproteobacteria bacterium]|nr:phospholipase [Deltaproteobacteria bacterium]
MMSNKFHYRVWLITMGLLMIVPISSYAWSNHTFLTYPALRGLPEFQEPIPAEPLESFLVKEKDKIGELLKAEEAWAVSNITAYPPLPTALDFSKSKEADFRLRFLKALRLNPEMKLPLYSMVLPGSPVPAKQSIPRTALSVLKHDFQNTIYVPLNPGEKISALEVLATAADEPDNGLDINLWEDNDTPFGKEYGYGKQPFGNPKLDYGTQAPFHMGFYHESSIVYKAAPSFQKTFPEQRAHLYQSLTKLAFQTGHSYWGYRFAGWGLHYVQDMTMPYHTTIMPGRMTITMLSIALLDMIGIHGPYKSAVSEVSRAHILIEKLQNEGLREAYKKQQKDYVLFKALGDSAADSAYPAYSDHFISQVAAKGSNVVAKSLPSILKAIVTDKKAYRDIEKISEEGDYDAGKIIAGAPEKKAQEYNRLIENQMRSLGAFTRIYLKSIK